MFENNRRVIGDAVNNLIKLKSGPKTDTEIEKHNDSMRSLVLIVSQKSDEGFSFDEIEKIIKGGAQSWLKVKKKLLRK